MNDAAKSLLTPHDLAAIQAQVLDMRTRRRATNTALLPGSRLSHFRGLGMELVDNRPYAAGDDIRHIDWRATARSTRPVSKIFRAEKQRELLLVVDRSPSMAFGTRTQPKAAAAARCAAALAFGALADHDTVAMLLFGDQLRYFPSGRTDAHLGHLLNAACANLTPHADNHGGFDFAAAWPLLSRCLSPRVTLIMISDFFPLDASVYRRLKFFTEHAQVAAVRVSDPAEMKLPDAGRVRLSDYAADGERLVIDFANERLRNAFAQEMQSRRDAFSRELTNAGIDVIDIRTDEDVLPRLDPLL